MLEKLYQRTGIKLTERQIRLVQKLLRFLISFAIGSLILGGSLLIAQKLSPNCGAYSQGYHLQSVAQSCYASTNSKIPLIGLAGFGILAGISGISFFLSLFTYALRILTDKDFRENEMTQSVSYVEADEREQMITMQATRRAYMVLNFTLLAGWFLSVLSGHFDTAILLFIIQLIGTLSYRKEALK